LGDSCIEADDASFLQLQAHVQEQREGVMDNAGKRLVYIVRHGEKVWDLGCLNDVGWSRAFNLVDVFNGQPSPKHSTFKVPNYIFAHWYDDPIDCERCKQTATPLSSALGVHIDMTHGGGSPGTGPGGGNAAAAAAILHQLQVTGGPVFVAWEHLNIQTLTADLGVAQSSIPQWPESDYDSVYILEYGSNQSLTNFAVSAQNFSMP
jgi:hypothetical protein